MLTRDEILAIYAAGPEAVVELIEMLLASQRTLTARVAELEARLNRDSHNSNQPPSSDGLGKKPRPRSLRKRSGKKSGGQSGHPGMTLMLVDEPTSYREWTPTHCAACGVTLTDGAVVNRERRQVIDLPEPRLEIVEHQAVHLACPSCQAVTAGAFPTEVTQPVQYGPRVKATAVYLQVGQFLSYERTVEALRDLFGVMWSEGTLTTAQATAYARLSLVETVIVTALRQQAVVTVDETGIRVGDRLHWLHVVGSAHLTYYARHAKRGRAALLALGVLVGYAGRRMHDAWAPYLKLPGLYALCNAHLLRELIAVSEDDARQIWATRLIRLLLSMKTAVNTARTAGQTALPARHRTGFEAAYTRLLRAGEKANPPPRPTARRGRPKQTTARNLLDRLSTHRSAVLAFLYDFRVPFDNNQAERDLRMAKVKLKVSGCFRSPTGADYFCRIRSYISTLHKQNYSVFAGLVSVFAGRPHIPLLSA